MNEYKFQYTKPFETLLVLLASMLSCVITLLVLRAIFVDISKNMAISFTILSLIVPFICFRCIKELAVRNCIAMLNSESIVFEFKNDIVRTINFNDLTFYKVYHGKNGPVLYLNNTIDRF